MATSTLTDKGQTTVPQEVRQALGIKPRQQLEWTVRRDGTALVRPRAGAPELFGSLRPRKRLRHGDAERQGTVRAVAKQAAKEGMP